MADLAPVRS